MSNYYSLGEMFDPRANQFCIPEYQRAYAWTEKNIDDLFEDIINHTSSKPYFFGTFLLEKGISDKNASMNRFFVIDGQQRLTTMILFISILVRKLRALSNDEHATLLYERYIHDRHTKFIPFESDIAFWNDLVINGTNPSPTFPSQHRLKKALTYLNKKFDKADKLLDEIKLKTISNVINNSAILTHCVDDKEEAAQMFEMTNDRGKPLTDLESLKSYFMYKSLQHATDTDSALTQIQNYFTDIYRTLENFEQKFFDEDSILRFIYIAYYCENRDYSKPKENIKTFVNEQCLLGNHNVIFEMLHVVKEGFATARRLFDNKKQFEYLDCLKAQGRIAQFMPLLIKAYSEELDDDEWDFSTLLYNCEIYAFVIWGLAKKRSDAGQNELYALAKNFSSNYEEVAGRIFQMSGWWNADEISKINITGNDVYRASYNEAKYILWNYENYLREEKGFPKISLADYQSSGNREKLTIEHIYSQNNIHKQGFEANELDSVFLSENMHCIGNLILDPRASNSSKSDSTVEKKVSSFDKAPFISHNNLANYLVDGKWTRESFCKRQSDLLEFIKDAWCLEWDYGTEQ